MRLFFACDIPAADKLKIENWREKAFPDLDCKVHAGNFHVTLAFLGEVENHQIEALCDAADEVELSAFSYQFNHIGYWPKAKILWLGGNQDSPLHQLASPLVSAGAREGLYKDKRDYIPHVSLYRHCEQPPAALISPDFSIRFENFGLFQSVNGPSGVRYHCIQQWQLRPF